MNLENLENKETLINDFFTWLFDDYRIINKEVNLEKEIDLVLAPYYIDANIYYPKKIADFFNTKAMKRLGRISQLDLLIDSFPNVYHNRLEHSKGVYYRKLEEMLYNFQDHTWKTDMENRGFRIYLLADLIKMAGHDIGHLPLSHALELEILNHRGAHEIIGKRIMLENPEINSILTSISPELPKVLKELYEKNILNFQEHDESNYDVDRFDYISRDTLFAGNPVHIPYCPYQRIPVIQNELGHPETTDDGSILTSDTSTYTIDVYDYDSLHDIEHFLEIRESGYITMYLSINTHVREKSIGSLFKSFINSDTVSGKNLKNFVTQLRSCDLNTSDLSFLLDWDDLKFYSEILDIAQNHEDSNVRLLATMTVPHMKAFLTMLYSHLNIHNKEQTYSDEDRQFLKKIKKLIQGKDSLSNNLKTSNFAMKNTLIFNKPLPIHYASFVENQLINSFSGKIRAYNPNEPIYIKDSNGKIYELSRHPETKYDWNNRITYLNYMYAYIPYLKLNGLSNNEITDLCNFCNNDVVQNVLKTKPVVNMQPLKVGHNIEDEFLQI